MTIRGVCPVFVLFLSIACANAADERVIVLKAARVFDGKSKTLATNGVVVVQGEKIADAGSNLPIPQNAQVIDLGDATLSPGFIVSHTHLTFDYSGDYNKTRLGQVSANVSEHAIRATTFARATVEAGFTTVRDLGNGFVNSPEFVDVGAACFRLRQPC